MYDHGARQNSISSAQTESVLFRNKLNAKLPCILFGNVARQNSISSAQIESVFFHNQLNAKLP